MFSLDIVFCRTWFKVDVPRFYAPVTSMLLPLDQKSQWQGMKTVGQLKREAGIRAIPNSDHSYREVVRKEKAFKPLTIPKSLQKALPYKFKPKEAAASERADMEQQRVAVVRSPHEEKIARMMRMIKANYEMKRQKQTEIKGQQMQKFKQEKAAEEYRKLQKRKELRRQLCRSISKQDRFNKSKDK